MKIRNQIKNFLMIMLLCTNANATGEKGIDFYLAPAPDTQLAQEHPQVRIYLGDSGDVFATEFEMRWGTHYFLDRHTSNLFWVTVKNIRTKAGREYTGIASPKEFRLNMDKPVNVSIEYH